MKTLAKHIEKLQVGDWGAWGSRQSRQMQTKEVSEELIIEAETAVKWVNTEPSPKWQSAKE